MSLVFFMHVGVHIVCLAPSVLPRCIITAHVYAARACLCVRVPVSEWTTQIQPTHNLRLYCSFVHHECQLTHSYEAQAQSQTLTRIVCIAGMYRHTQRITGK